MNQTLIIVPTYNERENLPRMVATLLALPVAVDVLVVDDNSPDGTGKIADELAAKHPQINVLHRSEKNGLGRAYIAGFQWALAKHYEFIFEMDCDFSHDPAEIPNFLKAAEKADLVLGSRYSGGVRVLNWPLKRLMLSRCAGVYVWLITGMPFTDPTGGFKCFRRRALQAIALEAVRSNGYSFQIEMTHRLWRDGFNVTEVPIIFTERVQGASKLSRGIVTEAFWMVWWLWLQNGCRRSPRVKPAQQLLMTSEFEKHARLLNDLKFSETARRFYEVMSGALMWEDEKAKLPFSELGWFRAVLAYRSSLILGQPRKDFESIWDALKRVAPNWPGFRVERCTASQELVDYLNTQRESSKRSLDQFA